MVQHHEGVLCAGNGDPSMFTLLPADAGTNMARIMTVSPGAGALYSISIVAPSAAVGQVQLNGTAVPAASFHPYAGDPNMRFASVSVTAGTHTVASASPFIAYMVCRVSGDCYVYPAAHHPFVPPATDTLICSSDPTITLHAPLPLDQAAWTSVSSGDVLAHGSPAVLTLPHADTIVLTGTLPVSGCAFEREYALGQALGTPGAAQLKALANGTVGTTICQYGSVALSIGPGIEPSWFDLSWTPAISINC